jgi:ureidoglycolate lyase
MIEVSAIPMNETTFAQFGDVLDCSGEPDKIINQGKCGRYHDGAELNFGDGRPGVSIFSAERREFPYVLDMVERHPLGTQTFVPMSAHPFLVIVAPDEDGKPGTPQAFVTKPFQAINFHRNTWHGVLTPLFDPGLFAVVDRIGEGENLEEFWFDTPYKITAPTS